MKKARETGESAACVRWIFAEAVCIIKATSQGGAHHAIRRKPGTGT